MRLSMWLSVSMSNLRHANLMYPKKQLPLSIAHLLKRSERFEIPFTSFVGLRGNLLIGFGVRMLPDG